MSLALNRFNPDTAAVLHNDLRRDIQPQARATHDLFASATVETIENMRQILGGDAHPLIADRYQHLLREHLRARFHLALLVRRHIGQLHCDRAAIWRVSNGVCEQVIDHLPKTPLIGGNLDVGDCCVKYNQVLGTEPLCCFYFFFKQRNQVRSAQ